MSINYKALAVYGVPISTNEIESRDDYEEICDLIYRTDSYEDAGAAILGIPVSSIGYIGYTSIGEPNVSCKDFDDVLDILENLGKENCEPKLYLILQVS